MLQLKLIKYEFIDAVTIFFIDIWIVLYRMYLHRIRYTSILKWGLWKLNKYSKI